MKVGFEFLWWLLAAISFGLGAFAVTFPKTKPINWMLLGYMFVALALLVLLAR